MYFTVQIFIFIKMFESVFPKHHMEESLLIVQCPTVLIQICKMADCSGVC